MGYDRYLTNHTHCHIVQTHQPTPWAMIGISQLIRIVVLYKTRTIQTVPAWLVVELRRREKCFGSNMLEFPNTCPSTGLTVTYLLLELELEL